MISNSSLESKYVIVYIKTEFTLLLSTSQALKQLRRKLCISVTLIFSHTMTNTQDGNFQISYSGACSLVTARLQMLTVTVSKETKATLVVTQLPSCVRTVKQILF